MKKIFLSTILGAFLCTAINAQDIKFGAKVGVNFANLNTDGLEEYLTYSDGRTSMHIGAVAEFILNDKFSVQPELLYSGQGGKEEFPGEYRERLNFGYLNLPIIAKYYITDGFSLEAGPQLGFLLSSKYKEEDIGDGLGGLEEDFKDTTKGIDFSFCLGAGYKLNNGLNFAARYSLGLSNVLDTSSDYIDEDDRANASVKNGVFQISVGFMF